MLVVEWLIGAPQQSGAIDVVAIKKNDGSISCSPFHVKLNKGSKHGDRKVVKLRVNGVEAKLSMKLGPAGEAFFVERTRERVQKEYRTSPPMSPINSTSPYANNTVPSVTDDDKILSTNILPSNSSMSCTPSVEDFDRR